MRVPLQLVRPTAVSIRGLASGSLPSLVEERGAEECLVGVNSVAVPALRADRLSMDSESASGMPSGCSGGMRKEGSAVPASRADSSEGEGASPRVTCDSSGSHGGAAAAQPRSKTTMPAVRRRSLHCSNGAHLLKAFWLFFFKCY